MDTKIKVAKIFVLYEISYLTNSYSRIKIILQNYFFDIF